MTTTTGEIAIAKWERARQVIPRGASSGHRVGWDQIFTKASGAYLWDDQGRRYLDHLNSYGAIILGHCDSRVNEAVYKSVSTCDLTGIGPQSGEVELAEKICGLLPAAQKVAFCTSGTDACMHAVQLARAATGRQTILKFHGTYHGWSDLLAVGSARADLTPDSPFNTPNGAGLHPGSLADVVVIEWNDFDGLRQAFDLHGPELAAAFAEPYVHSFGCVPPLPGFLELLRELCTRHGAALVFDEMKTGFRASLGGYQSICEIKPDLTIFGKAVANGYTLAGLAGTNEFMGHVGAYSKSEATMDGTYNANPYGLAAANATLHILETEEIHSRLYTLGDQLRTGVAQAITDVGIDACVTGLGSEWTIYFRKEAPVNFRQAMDTDTEQYRKYHQSLLAQGIIETSGPIGDRRINAAMTSEDVDFAIDAIRKALSAAAQQ